MAGSMFCPKCGSIMRPTKQANGVVLVCPKCGYTSAPSGRVVLTHQIQHSEKEKMAVITQEIKSGVVHKGYVTCPKCGHDEVYVYMMQTRRADEPPTRFYKCVKCGYTWREYA